MDGSRALLYFDHNATSPLCAAAREAWLEAVERFPANPSSPHRLGARADRALQAARERLAHNLGARPEQVVFTSGATESNNLLIRHFADVGREAWISGIEHPSVYETTKRVFGDRVCLIPVSRGGRVDVGWIENHIRERRPAFIAVMAANNETGVLQPWREIAEICRAEEVPYLCDASQLLGKVSAPDLAQSSFVTGCGHKFGSAPGIGFVVAPKRLRPLLLGGPQEDGQRAGTENLPGALSMLAALEDRLSILTGEFLGQRSAMREVFCKRLKEELPNAIVLGDGEHRLWNTVSVILPLADCRQRWIVKLDKANVAASTGSACASGKEKASHVLTAMGYSSDEAARAIRFSAGWETSDQEWKALLERVLECATVLV